MAFSTIARKSSWARKDDDPARTMPTLTRLNNMARIESLPPVCVFSQLLFRKCREIVILWLGELLVINLVEKHNFEDIPLHELSAIAKSSAVHGIFDLRKTQTTSGSSRGATEGFGGHLSSARILVIQRLHENRIRLSVRASQEPERK